MSNGNDSFDVASMFDSIKDSLKNERKNSGFFKDILKMEPVNTYIVRLVPNIESLKKTFFHYSHHGWKSLATGQYVDAVCPSTWDDRCPICEEMFRLYRKKTEQDKALAKFLNRMDKHLVNAYVIEDPTTPENKGQLKILRFGVRLHEKITAATDGDDAKEFGPRIYDLSEQGCSFKIKVETNKEGSREFTNYSNSRFMAPSAIEGLTPDKIKAIYEGIHNLEEFITVKSYEELKKMLDIHFHCKVEGDAAKKESLKEDNLNMETSAAAAQEAVKKAVEAASEKPAETPKEAPKETPKEAPKEAPKEEPKKTPDRAKIDNLLADLDNI
jgi:hypothetical protein